MAKKKNPQRRVPRAADQRMYGDGKPSQVAQQAERNGTSTAAPAASRPAAPAGRTMTAGPRVPVTTTANYDYVLKDLRRLGIVAVSIFAVLIALGLIFG